MSLALFALGIFKIGHCILCLGRPGPDPPFYTASIAGTTGMHHHTQLFWIEMGSLALFARASLEHDPPCLYCLRS
jgi:hypothetical protein